MSVQLRTMSNLRNMSGLRIRCDDERDDKSFLIFLLSTVFVSRLLCPNGCDAQAGSVRLLLYPDLIYQSF